MTQDIDPVLWLIYMRNWAQTICYPFRGPMYAAQLNDDECIHVLTNVHSIIP